MIKKACFLLLLVPTTALAGDFWQNLKGRSDVSIEDRREWGGPGAAPIELMSAGVVVVMKPYPWNPEVDWSKVKMMPASKGAGDMK